MRIVLWFSIIVATALYICGPLQDPDLWWHITIGRWIISNAEIPSTEHWNRFALGEPFRAYSWFCEIVFAWLDGWFGIEGLLIAKFALIVGIGFSLFYFMGRLADDWFMGGVLGLFATVSCFNHYTLRPQSLVWVFLIAIIYYGDQINRHGLNRKNAIPIAAVMCLWANTHITTALGIFTLAGWVFKPDKIKLTVFVVLIAFAGTLVTPYLGGEWLTFLSKTDHPLQHASIAEFQPANIMQYSTGLLVIAFVFLASFLHFQPKALSIWQILVVGGFTLIGLAVVKFLPFSVILITAATAVLWRKARSEQLELGNLAEAIENLRELFEKIPREGLSFVFMCLAVVSFFKVWNYPLSFEVVPVQAMNFILKEKLPHPLMNDFGKGGYVMYRLSDKAGNIEHPVSIDGRTNITPPEIYESSKATFHGKMNWRDYIEKVQPKTILWRYESPGTTLLFEDPEWCMVYRSGEEEQGMVVFVAREFYEQNAERFVSEDCNT